MSSAGYELQFNVGMRRTFYTRVARAALAGPRIVKDHETEIQTGYRNHMFTCQLPSKHTRIQLINYVPCLLQFTTHAQYLALVIIYSGTSILYWR